MHVFYAVIDNTIDLECLTLHKGVEYGCKLQLISKNTKTVNIKCITEVYYSDHLLKPLMAYVNDKLIQLVRKKLRHKMVYSIDLTLYDEVTNMLVCSNMDPDLIDRYYANICLDFDNNVYTVKDKNYSNAVIEYPVVCNFRRYSESDSDSDSDVDDRAELHKRNNDSDSDDYT
ncbi:CPXV020 protein [Cowpox virus]|uniref:CPXV020 protein n=1 Tax=Cowpox virus TaxID=10243 RepID=A0A212Q1G2_COWPX|nr:CPXV020 protein [Cowpox virus]SNB49810.1 CPXV020 protein [Cowpox virus]SNB49915.1 CPXV020 protein [Cowpox virus]SNB53201.1 CPXV020 protein [Cowpox virus]SPN68936.1 CPXV020 protein [Cowpox virus]